MKVAKIRPAWNIQMWKMLSRQNEADKAGCNQAKQYYIKDQSTPKLLTYHTVLQITFIRSSLLKPFLMTQGHQQD